MSRSRQARVAAAAGSGLALASAAVAILRRRRPGGAGAGDAAEIARRVLEDPWQGELDEVIDLIDESYVGYAPGSEGAIHGREGFRAFVTAYLTAFPDGRIVVKEAVARGDAVAQRWTARGTNTGELMGMPPTGREVTVEGMTFARVAGGRVVEARTTWDTLALMQQLGAVPEHVGA